MVLQIDQYVCIVFLRHSSRLLEYRFIAIAQLAALILLLFSICPSLSLCEYSPVIISAAF